VSRAHRLPQRETCALGGFTEIHELYVWSSLDLETRSATQGLWRLVCLQHAELLGLVGWRTKMRSPACMPGACKTSLAEQIPAYIYNKKMYTSKSAHAHARPCAHQLPAKLHLQKHSAHIPGS